MSRTTPGAASANFSPGTAMPNAMDTGTERPRERNWDEWSDGGDSD